MVIPMFRHIAFALMVPTTNGCLERALLRVEVQLYQTASQVLERLLEVGPAHEELASLHDICARSWWCT